MDALPEKELSGTLLPEDFLDKMKAVLGDSYADYLKSFSMTPFCGLRFNTLKVSGKETGGGMEEIRSQLPFSLEPVLWEENGFYFEESKRPARHPYYFAGLYYLQEPSAMTPAGLLPVNPGELVLDLCAAPGGKSTKLAEKLQGKGLLFSNDISNSRAKALLRNLERFGASNILVASEEPEKLSGLLPEFFDKILVDAPCSGEGMFRRDKEMAKSYRERGPQYYTPLQRQILNQAALMLRPGGMILYSTCTFDEEENEGTVRFILKNHPELTLINLFEGREALFEKCGFQPGIGLDGCVRLFPHRVRGEGHFLALLKKEEAGKRDDVPLLTEKLSRETRLKLPEDAIRFFSLIGGELGAELKAGLEPKAGRLYRKNDSLYLLPEAVLPFQGKLLGKIRYLRTGLLLGELKKDRFEPSQALAMALKMEDFACSVNFASNDERAIRYLKGETVSLDETVGEKTKSSWRLVCVDQYPLGFGKALNGMLKNKYSPGWRWQ